MRVRHYGLDGLDLAFHGEFDSETIEQIDAAKKQAVARDDLVAVTLNAGYGDVLVQVEPKGWRGGYRYVIRTEGESGLIIAVKAPKASGKLDWSAFVSCRAGYLLERPDFAVALRGIRTILATLGWRSAPSEQGHTEAVGRVDFALDVEPREGVEIDPRAIATRAKKHTVEEIGATYDGDAISYVRIGSLPGRQIAIYDKTRQARETRKLFWFKRWGLDPKTEARVWRIEVRLGKEHLRDNGVQTPEQLAREIGQLTERAVAQVRLIERREKNVTRCPDTPFWARVRALMAKAVAKVAQPVPLGAVARFCAKQREAELEQQIRGSLTSLFALRGLDFGKHAFSVAAEQVKRGFLWDVEDRFERYRGKYLEARERYATC